MRVLGFILSIKVKSFPNITRDLNAKTNLLIFQVNYLKRKLKGFFLLLKLNNCVKLLILDRNTIL